MKRKIIALGMASVMTLSLAACGGNDSDGWAKDVGAGTSVHEIASDTEVRDDVIIGPENLTAFGQQYADANVMPGLLDLESEDGANIADIAYPGLSSVAMKQCAMFVSPNTDANSEMVLVEVEDVADVEAVKNIMQTRIDTMVESNADNAVVMDVWHTNAQIVVNGNFVAMIAVNSVNDFVDAFNNMFAEDSEVSVDEDVTIAGLGDSNAAAEDEPLTIKGLGGK